MGANSHERVVDLWRPGVTMSKPTGKRIRDQWGGYRDEYVTTTGRRKRLTPEEAWGLVYDEEGYEDGHSYSGSFGSKHGMVVLARNEKLDPVMGEVGAVVAFLNGEWDEALKPPKRGKITCTGCYGSGKKFRLPMGVERDTCPDCNGEGKRLRNAEERAAIRKTIAARKKVLALLGETTLRRIAAVYDDKWGPAAAVVGKDKVWFGGYCSS